MYRARWCEPGGANLLATAHTPQSQPAHEPFHGTARHRNVLAVHLLPDLLGTVDLHIGLPDTFDMRHQPLIALGPGAA